LCTTSNPSKGLLSLSLICSWTIMSDDGFVLVMWWWRIRLFAWAGRRQGSSTALADIWWNVMTKSVIKKNWNEWVQNEGITNLLEDRMIADRMVHPGRLRRWRTEDFSEPARPPLSEPCPGGSSPISPNTPEGPYRRCRRDGMPAIGTSSLSPSKLLRGPTCSFCSPCRCGLLDKENMRNFQLDVCFLYWTNCSIQNI
jgi:hypothetical protein